MLIRPAQPTQKIDKGATVLQIQELTEDNTDWIKADQLVGMLLFNISTVFVFNKSYFSL